MNVRLDVILRVWVCVYVCMYYGLTLWCCMMAVDFRLADIFSLSGCPLCSPSVRNICLDGLYRPVRLCPPVSLSFALPSVFLCYWQAIGEGTATITRNTKAREGRERGERESDSDRRMHAVTHSLSRPYRSRRFLFCLLSSLPPDGFLWRVVRSYSRV